jgi:hypothetical protein
VILSGRSGERLLRLIGEDDDDEKLEGGLVVMVKGERGKERNL